MTISYTKISEPIKRNCYEFLFSFEHGDADSSEEYYQLCQDMSEEEFVSYCQKSQEISEQISQSRSSGTSLPDDFEDLARSGRFAIPVERDNYAKMHMSGYYAASGIVKSFFYNADGEKFLVGMS